MKKTLSNVLGWASWKLCSTTTEACVTETGGHLAPVVFDRQEKKIQPYAVAPWFNEQHADQPKIIQVLRGDFFCLPFGGNQAPYRGEKHPVHGDTANLKWTLLDQRSEHGVHTLRLRMKTRTREGLVEKQISLRDGENAVYSRHIIQGLSGPMPLGHHAMLKFPDHPRSGLISTSPFIYGQVFPEPTECPAQKGYSWLKPGAIFKTLSKVPSITGENVDLSVYPARRGFEDIAILVTDPKLALGWTAVSFPKEGYVWFALKDPKMLASTLLWLSNSGRYYAPWSGRHVNVMGLEEVTSCFHYGLKVSAGKNVLNARGIKTAVPLSKSKPTVVNYIMACVPTPKGFDRVKTIQPARDRQSVTLTSHNGKRIEVAVDVEFLHA